MQQWQIDILRVADIEVLEAEIKGLEATVKWYTSEGQKETAMIYIEYLMDAEYKLEQLKTK